MLTTNLKFCCFANKDLSTCVQYFVLVEKSVVQRPPEDPGVDGIVVIKWILQKMEAMLWGGCI